MDADRLLAALDEGPRKIVGRPGPDETRRCTGATVPPSTPLPYSDDDTMSSDRLAPPDLLPEGSQTAPSWVWVLVRATEDLAEQVWVRFPAETAPDGLAVRRAAPPKSGSLGVAIIRLPLTLTPETVPTKRRYRPRRPRVEPADRNLVTVGEFAVLVPCAESSVHELIKLGLPAQKIPNVGRRIMKKEALEWLVAGGARKSRVALKLARAAYRARKQRENGAADGAE